MSPSPDDRRTDALQTAFGLFLRFGFRKTSMDDVARAAGVSRQGLYVWYPNKKALFAAVVEHALDQMLHQMQGALATDAPLHERLLEAFTRLAGLHTDPSLDPSTVDELFEASERLLGDRVEAFHGQVRAQLVQALPAGSPSPEDLADTLLAASTGIKHTVRDREAYRAALERMIAVIVR